MTRATAHSQQQLRNLTAVFVRALGSWDS